MRESIECLLTVLQRKYGWTLQEVAKKTGISMTTLRKWRDDGKENVIAGSPPTQIDSPAISPSTNLRLRGLR